MREAFIIMRAEPTDGWRLAHGEFFRTRGEAHDYLWKNYRQLGGSSDAMFTVERLDLHEGATDGR